MTVILSLSNPLFLNLLVKQFLSLLMKSGLALPTFPLTSPCRVHLLRRLLPSPFPHLPLLLLTEVIRAEATLPQGDRTGAMPPGVGPVLS